MRDGSSGAGEAATARTGQGQRRLLIAVGMVLPLAWTMAFVPWWVTVLGAAWLAFVAIVLGGAGLF